jgi:chaperonin GroEL (HSP60 family)
LEKLFVTNDAATIMKELDVVHPAAKMIVLASQQQEAEMGDATNFVIVFAGQLLQNAEYLLKMGLHISEVMEGYRVAGLKAIELFEGTVHHSILLSSEFQGEFAGPRTVERREQRKHQSSFSCRLCKQQTRPSRFWNPEEPS